MITNIITLLFRLFGFTAWLERLQAKQEGRTEQRAKDLEASNEALRRQAEARAKAPKTTEELLDRLEHGQI